MDRARRHRSSPLRLLVLALLGAVLTTAQADSDAVRSFKRAWATATQAGDADRQQAALRDLGQEHTEDAAELLLAIAVQDDLDYEVHDAAERALLGLAGSEVLLWAADAVDGGERSARKRAMLCRYLGSKAKDNPDSGLLLLPGLRDREWQVQVAAVQGLTHVRRPEVVGALVQALLDAEGRLAAAQLETSVDQS